MKSKNPKTRINPRTKENIAMVLAMLGPNWYEDFQQDAEALGWINDEDNGD